MITMFHYFNVIISISLKLLFPVNVKMLPQPQRSHHRDLWSLDSRRDPSISLGLRQGRPGTLQGLFMFLLYFYLALLMMVIMVVLLSMLSISLGLRQGRPGTLQGVFIILTMMMMNHY